MTDEEPREMIHKDVDPVAAALVGLIAGAIAHDSHGQAVVYVPRSQWREAARCLRDEGPFTQWLDVTVVDHLVDNERLVVDGVTPERFEVVANFLSHPRNLRVRVISEVPEREPSVGSITDLYPGADFAEREAFDLYGITFDGHPALSRIL